MSEDTTPLITRIRTIMGVVEATHT
jgi:hypothetical protein